MAVMRTLLFIHTHTHIIGDKVKNNMLHTAGCSQLPAVLEQTRYAAPAAGFSATSVR